MKNKHNKKRNTAFVFEALAREATTAIIKGDLDVGRRGRGAAPFVEQSLALFLS